VQRSVSNSSLLILLASDILAYLYIYPDSPLGSRIWHHRHVNTLTVAPATLNYHLSSLVESGIDENIIRGTVEEIIEEIKKYGIQVPHGYRFERIKVDQPEALYKAELEYAANQPSALITYHPHRYTKYFLHEALYIWNIKRLLIHLHLEHSHQIPTLAESDSQADQPSAQTSEDEACHEAPPSRFRNLVVQLLIAVLGNQLLRSDRSPKSQPTRQTPQKSTSGDVAQEKKPIEFHAPTTSSSDINAALNASSNTIKQASTSTFSNASDGRLNQLVNQGGQFSGAWLLSQISKNDNHADSPFKTTPQSLASTPSSLAETYNLTALRSPPNTESQRSGSLDRAFSESNRDRAVFIPQPFLFAGNFDLNNLNLTDFDVALLLRLSPLPRLPFLPSNQTDTVSLINPTSNLEQPSDRPVLVPEIDKLTVQEPENSIVPPQIVVTAPPQIAPPQKNGSGGTKSFDLTSGSYEITNFGGVGTTRDPSKDPLKSKIGEVDTIYFRGAQLVAQNLLLTQQEKNLLITFEGVQNTSVVLKAFNLEDLDNFSTLGEAPIMLANIVFAGETFKQDSFDVVSNNLIIDNLNKIFNKNSVTFLDDLGNNVTGFDESNDVINSQGGKDFLQGLGGDDILRGGTGDDILWGGTGADLLDGGTGNNSLTGGAGADIFRLCQGGFSQVTDFQTGEDRIGLPADIQIDQVAIEQGTGLNSSSTLIRFKPDGSVLMALSGVLANSLTTDIFLPSTSSLMR
jgi:Ca2+-binding RTX toxin-like protein